MKGIAGGCGVRVEAGSESLISWSAASMLLQTATASGLAVGLSRGLASWRPARAVHDPGKTVLDLAVAIAVGGDCLADVAMLRPVGGAGQARRHDPQPGPPPTSRASCPTGCRNCWCADSSRSAVRIPEACTGSSSPIRRTPSSSSRPPSSRRPSRPDSKSRGPTGNAYCLCVNW